MYRQHLFTLKKTPSLSNVALGLASRKRLTMHYIAQNTTIRGSSCPKFFTIRGAAHIVPKTYRRTRS